MINTLLIILPVLILLTILGHFFAHLYSHQSDKYERIYQAFSYANLSFTPSGRQHIVGAPEQSTCKQ
ncbi:MAG TPA: hypothetical protein VGM01_02670 [Ktedonobacteraceae bacterium]